MSNLHASQTLKVRNHTKALIETETTKAKRGLMLSGITQAAVVDAMGEMWRRSTVQCKLAAILAAKRRFKSLKSKSG